MELNTVLSSIQQELIEALKPEDKNAWTVEAASGRVTVEEIRRHAKRAPCVLVSVLGFREYEQKYKGQPVVFSVFCIGKDRVIETAPGKRERLDRSEIAQSLACMVMDEVEVFQHERKMQAPLNMKAENLYSGEIQKEGISLWGVSWNQRFELRPAPGQMTDLKEILHLSTQAQFDDPDTNAVPHVAGQVTELDQGETP